ncbi:hypothetical protein BV898_10342 [Hypsibius exemplaris]|uniref:Uncharacterized protein n=1 Tax=Hypsibius exemplaris TaxID=2072580 RepID=A0A1W0WJR3_HYPEX|nr:hypothetical protein BV898_10342 [Hypsibius exemplaris]
MPAVKSGSGREHLRNGVSIRFLRHFNRKEKNDVWTVDVKHQPSSFSSSPSVIRTLQPQPLATDAEQISPKSATPVLMPIRLSPVRSRSPLTYSSSPVAFPSESDRLASEDEVRELAFYRYIEKHLYRRSDRPEIRNLVGRVLDVYGNRVIWFVEWYSLMMEARGYVVEDNLLKSHSPYQLLLIDYYTDKVQYFPNRIADLLRGVRLVLPRYTADELIDFDPVVAPTESPSEVVKDADDVEMAPSAEPPDLAQEESERDLKQFKFAEVDRPSAEPPDVGAEGESAAGPPNETVAVPGCTNSYMRFMDF